MPFPAPISPNYAEVWQPQLLQIKIQEALTSPFIVSNVKWLAAQTFHFTQMSISGFKNHVRTGGYGAGVWTQKDVPYTVQHTRDIEIFIDKADVDETNYTASIENIASIFQKTQSVPENDAYFFERVAHAAANGVWHGGNQKAEAASDLTSNTKISAYQNAVVAKLKSYISKLKKYRPTLLIYINSQIMDYLEMTTEIHRKIEMVTIPDGGIGIETRYTSIDGVPVLEIWEEDRFYEAFDYAARNDDWDGFRPRQAKYKKTTDTTKAADKTYYVIDEVTEEYREAETDDFTTGAFTAGTDYYERTVAPAKKLNVIVASRETVITVPKITSIYFFPPGTHTRGDGHLFQNREDWDTFVFPNGKDNKVDSVYADFTQAE